MEPPQIKRYIRPIGEVRKIMLERSRVSRNSFEFTDHEKIERAFSALISLDRDAWAEAFSALAHPHEIRPPMVVPRMNYPVGNPCFLRNLNRKSLTSLEGEVVSTTKSSVSFAPRTTQPFPKNLVVAFSKSGSFANFR